jgi:hypothetical protein
MPKKYFLNPVRSTMLPDIIHSNETLDVALHTVNGIIHEHSILIPTGGRRVGPPFASKQDLAGFSSLPNFLSPSESYGRKPSLRNPASQE